MLTAWMGKYDTGRLRCQPLKVVSPRAYQPREPTQPTPKLLGVWPPPPVPTSCAPGDDGSLRPVLAPDEMEEKKEKKRRREEERREEGDRNEGVSLSACFFVHLPPSSMVWS